MKDSRYGKHMNWDYNKKMAKDEKFKCWCECEKHEEKHDKCKCDHKKHEEKHDKRKCDHKKHEEKKCHHRKHEKVFIDVDVEVEVDVDVEVKKRCKKKEKDYGHKDDYYYEEDSYYEDEKYSYKEEKSDKHRCKGCACDFLKRLEPGTLVDVFLSGGGSFLNLTFINLDPKSCCAYFLDLDCTGGSAAAAAATPVVIDCQKIDAIRRA
ncbi:hypothetical protein [Lysinibacillus parviboronicapiens]|nr:hypothetical protein [Lysinibacillus parviboronicapiens]